MPSLGALTRCPHSPPQGALTRCPHFPKRCPHWVPSLPEDPAVSSSRRRRLLASRCRVIRLRLYPHRFYPHRYPHPCPHPRTTVLVVAPSCCPPLSSPLSSPPGPHHSSPRRRRVYRYPHRSLGESMRRCSDCEGLGGCSEARVVVASSSRRRRRRVASFRGGKNLYASW